MVVCIDVYKTIKYSYNTNKTFYKIRREGGELEELPLDNSFDYAKPESLHSEDLRWLYY